MVQKPGLVELSMILIRISISISIRRMENGKLADIIPIVIELSHTTPIHLSDETSCPTNKKLICLGPQVNSFNPVPFTLHVSLARPFWLWGKSWYFLLPQDIRERRTLSN